ncbi:hypothetical protein ACFFSY_10625 [Paenibacillus aurantiacus]|uniref:Lipoprotein n=1 Tax=Paenibacillus aurantiacus TaxID=1936118 RepID=A0ABV5KPS5_9BACL
MRGTKRSGVAMLVLALAAMLALTGCGSVKNMLRGGGSEGNCGGIIDWVDFLMLNDVTYSHNYDGTSKIAAQQRGEKIGEVAYMLDGHACQGHRTKNGDASYLPVGTPIYAMIGYKPSFRVIAEGKVYEADRNPHAKTLGDLWDIEGKIEKVSLVSGMDGSPIGDFTPDATAFIAKSLPRLEIVGFDTIYEKHKLEYGIFLRVHLRDGTSLGLVFYEKANAFTAGAYGTEALKKIIVSERARIKRAAGM